MRGSFPIGDRLERTALALASVLPPTRPSFSPVRNGTTAIWSKEALHALTNAFWRDIVQALMHQLIQALHPSPTRTPVGQCYEDAPALTRSFVRCILMIASLSPGRKSWEERERERERERRRRRRKCEKEEGGLTSFRQCPLARSL